MRIPRGYLREDGPPSWVETYEASAYELAYLSDGPTRALEAATAELISIEAIRVDDDRRLTATAPLVASEHPIEQAVYDLAREGTTVEALREKVLLLTEPIRDVLTERGFMALSSSKPLLIASSVCVLALVKIGVGLSRDRPVVFLCAMLAVAVWRTLRFVPRFENTHAGDALVARACVEHREARSQPQVEVGGVSLGVALFGLATLNTYGMATLYTALLPSVASASGGCGGGDSGGGGCGGGGGGCGGGGCGGCGGCGG